MKNKIVGFILLVVACFSLWIHNQMKIADEQAENQRIEYEKEYMASQGYHRETHDESVERIERYRDKDSNRITQLNTILGQNTTEAEDIVNFIFAFMNRGWYYKGNEIIHLNEWDIKFKQLFENEKSAEKWLTNYWQTADIAINHEAHSEWNIEGKRKSHSKIFTEVIVKLKGYSDNKVVSEDYQLFLLRKKNDRYLIVKILDGKDAVNRWNAKENNAFRYYLPEENQNALDEYAKERENRPTKEREDAAFQFMLYRQNLDSSRTSEARKKIQNEWEAYKKQHPVAIEIEKAYNDKLKPNVE